MNIVTRRRRSKIEMLKDEHGEWVEDYTKVRDLAVDFFKALFSREDQNGCYDDIRGGFKQLFELESEVLTRPVTNEEVRNTMFSIGSDKAPREDDFSTVFFHNF